MNIGSTGATLRPVEIVGGGLAGLALGRALARAGVPVTVFEAHGYPRHRVCGEFITGLDPGTIRRLGLEPILEGALRHRHVTWFRRDRVIRRQTLPEPALGLSRHTLDARLADAFAAAGGTLLTETRVPLDDAPEGRVFANGRRRRPSPWLGLKVHARGLRRYDDLELHLGDRAYVGVAAVEDGHVNLCGLFHRRTGQAEAGSHPVASWLRQHLRAAGLGALAARLEAADIDEASGCAVAALDSRPLPPPSDRICLGDSLSMPPPFTGNGMAMALQGAALALEPLRAWAHGERTWTATVTTINRALWRRFRPRLISAHWLHPFLLQPWGQRWLLAAGRSQLLPLTPLYHLTHR